MGLLDTLSNIKKEGFDPKKDKVATNSKLDSGTYPVRLKSAQADVNKHEQTQLAITLEVVSGKDKNRLEVIYISFDDGLPVFVLEKNGRTLLKLAAMAGIEFTKKDLEDEYTAAMALEKVLGSQFLMNLSITENKKNPNYPYRNYDFGPMEDEINDPFGGTGSTIDISDDDLPF
ncbi:hypothetical protein [Enterococcus wangshanyuanii]|uniref:Single-stranded DNA-binding protein n=1 Tax=Enterococcus wangshanyuanii TaxID=2005703 RepID=A0ABQ1PXB2_9ENTE|nr:hypothetical protein [Enterococcus wangshanyuanii]GGD05706.1 hypothetical protein GCM10011573_38940 [Enterococcus wangshanyuanii]